MNEKSYSILIHYSLPRKVRDPRTSWQEGVRGAQGAKTSYRAGLESQLASNYEDHPRHTTTGPSFNRSAYLNSLTTSMS